MTTKEEYALKLRFQDSPEPYLLDISYLLFHLVRAHNFSVIISEDFYGDIPPEHPEIFFFDGGSRSLKRSHRIRVARIQKKSPLILEVIIPSLGATWILLQILEKIVNWERNKIKLELEIKKLRAEEEERKNRAIERYSRQLENPRVVETQKHIIKELSGNPFKLDRVNLRRHKPKKGNKQERKR